MSTHDEIRQPADPRPISGPDPVAVVLVEDDGPTRDLLAANLRRDAGIALMRACSTLAEARTAVVEANPRILITDLQLPDGHGTELIRTVRRESPETEIMVISVLGDESTVMAALSAGATGYILKDARPIDLIAAVHDLVAGRSPISAAIARHIIRQVQAQVQGQVQGQDKFPSQEPAETRPLLSARETDILWGIAKGFTYKDIAKRLGLSHQTVPTHIKNIYRKLEVNSRGEAVFAALERKLIRLP